MSGIDATAAARTRARSPDEDETAVRQVSKPRIELPKLVTSLRSANDAARDAARSFAAANAPIGVIDLSLYTDEALDREIDSASSRIDRLPPNQQDSARELLSRMQAEQVRRATPPTLFIDGIKSKAQIDAAVQREATFLFRYGARLSIDERAKHQQRLQALEMRSEQLHADEHRCDRARPTSVSASSLGGAHEVRLTADDLVASIRSGVTLGPADEQRIRATFENWRQSTCERTGQDPTRLVSSTSSAKATETEPSQEEVYGKYLEMIDAMRGSASAGLTFLYMLSRDGNLDTARTLVTATAHLSDAAISMPVRGSRTVQSEPRVEPKRDLGVENPEALHRYLDEAFGRGHAADTRFRGIDNSAFEMDPDKRTYGPYRPNRGEPRSVNEAIAVFEKQTGIKVPPWIKFTIDPKLGADRMANYTLERSGKPEAPFPFDSLQEKGVTVNLRPDVLQSDEAIVGVLRHELHELFNLDRMLQEGTSLKNRDVLSQIARNRGDNLHGQAWDVADLEVLLMRNPPGSPQHDAIVRRRDKLLDALEQRNHGSR